MQVFEIDRNKIMTLCGESEVETIFSRGAPAAVIAKAITEVVEKYPFFIDHYPVNDSREAPLVMVFRTDPGPNAIREPSRHDLRTGP